MPPTTRPRCRRRVDDTAAAALDNYDKSFKQTVPPANAFVIGIGKSTQ